MYTVDASTYQSPNHDARPEPVRALVLHSGEGSKTSDLYTLCNNKPPMRQRVSAHYYVDRVANIYRLVPDDRRAWHAGASSYLGLTDWNDFAIGIETEHQVGQLWPAAQRAALDWLCRQLIAQYRIEQRMVVAHRWIAPDRRSDPTNWPDPLLRVWISGLYTAPPPPPPAPAVRVLGATVYRDSALTQPVTHLPPGAVVRRDAAAPLPGYAPGAIHVVWDAGSGFMRADTVEVV